MQHTLTNMNSNVYTFIIIRIQLQLNRRGNESELEGDDEDSDNEEIELTVLWEQPRLLVRWGDDQIERASWWYVLVLKTHSNTSVYLKKIFYRKYQLRQVRTLYFFFEGQYIVTLIQPRQIFHFHIFCNQ